MRRCTALKCEQPQSAESPEEHRPISMLRSPAAAEPSSFNFAAGPQVAGKCWLPPTCRTYQRQRQAACGSSTHNTQTCCSDSDARNANLLLTEPQQTFDRRLALSGLVVSVLLGGLPQQATAGLIDEQQAGKVFESANQSVVSVADYKVERGEETSEGTGSGFFWDSYGHVVTNYHCVAKFATDRLGAQVMLNAILFCQPPVTMHLQF